MTRHDTQKYGMTRENMAWHGTGSHDMAWHGTGPPCYMVKALEVGQTALMLAAGQVNCSRFRNREHPTGTRVLLSCWGSKCTDKAS